MKLYRLEETRKPTDKKPYEWRACWMNGHRWEQDCGGNSKKLCDNWIENMLARAAFRFGTESESKSGFYCTYFLVREPWPEQVIEDLLSRLENLESEVRGLRRDD